MTQTGATQPVRKITVQCTLNGKPSEFLTAPYQSLLEVLRDVLSLTGTKEGCNDGNCGACTVSVDGRIVDSCLVLGAEMEGKTREFRAAIDAQIALGGRATKLMIDGGIKAHNAAQVADWGIEVAVVGSGLINDKGTIAENLAEIQQALDA